MAQLLYSRMHDEELRIDNTPFSSGQTSYPESPPARAPPPPFRACAPAAAKQMASELAPPGTSRAVAVMPTSAWCSPPSRPSPLPVPVALHTPLFVRALADAAEFHPRKSTRNPRPMPKHTPHSRPVPKATRRLDQSLKSPGGAAGCVSEALACVWRSLPHPFGRTRGWREGGGEGGCVGTGRAGG